MNPQKDCKAKLKRTHFSKVQSDRITVHCVLESLYSTSSGIHEFLYSVLKSLKKIREIAEFIPNQLRFHEKKL